MKRVKRLITTLLSLTMLIATLALSAQNEGTITLEITDVSSDNPQVASYADMMKGNQTFVYFKESTSLTKINMMGGMVKVDIKVDEEESTDVLMEMMGQKIWVNTTKAESDRMKAESDNPMAEMDIAYDEGDTKTIAGYECYKMSVEFPDAPEGSLTAYITDDISVRPPIINGVEVSEFKGFPLEYTFNNSMMSLTVTTTSFEQSVDDGVFALNTSGYQKMTMQEFMDMMGSMGGGNFGF